MNCERVVKPEKHKSRPVKVKIGNVPVVLDILAKSKVFKGHDTFNKVYISPDRRKEEHVERNNLVKELKQKREENPDMRLYIKQMAIDSAPT